MNLFAWLPARLRLRALMGMQSLMDAWIRNPGRRALYRKLQGAAKPFLIGGLTLVSLSAGLVFVIGLLAGTLDVVDGLIGAAVLGCFLYFCVHHFATFSIFLLFGREVDFQVPHLESLRQQSGCLTGLECWVARRLWTTDGLRVLQHQVLDACLPKVDDAQTRKARL